MERGDMRGVEIFEIFALKLDVFQRSEGGESGETEEGDDGVDVGMCRGGGMRIAMDVDWESVG
jgi:hypothetical protein